jgi:heme/copper-type cytochrome/quinol oxidase subunit 1
VNLTFFPLHFSGLQGYPRKYVDYRDFHSLWNSVSSYGSIITVLALFLFIYILYVSFFSFSLFLFDDKSSQNLEISLSSYVSFHSYTDSASFFIIRLL